MSKIKKSYTKEFIQESVNYALSAESIASAAKRSIFHYIEGYYNKQRMHSAIDYKIPYEVECRVDVRK